MVETRGSDGASCRFADREIFVPGFAAACVDPTGAGDLFASCFILSDLTGLPVDTGLAVANTGGMIAVETVGACRPFQPARSERTTGTKRSGVMSTEIMDEAVRPFRPLASSADGWRGRIGREFTPTSALAVVGAIIDRVCVEARHPRFAVTFDSREGSRDIALQAADLIARTCGSVPIVIRHLPTVTASYLTTGEVDYAVLVTANHNPPHWNGIKLKTQGGQPTSSQFVADVEQRLEADRTAGEFGCAPGNLPSHQGDRRLLRPAFRPHPAKARSDGPA